MLILYFTLTRLRRAEKLIYADFNLKYFYLRNLRDTNSYRLFAEFR
jgi:hypothetical protein